MARAPRLSSTPESSVGDYMIVMVMKASQRNEIGIRISTVHIDLRTEVTVTHLPQVEDPLHTLRKLLGIQHDVSHLS